MENSWLGRRCPQSDRRDETSQKSSSSVLWLGCGVIPLSSFLFFFPPMYVLWWDSHMLGKHFTQNYHSQPWKRLFLCSWILRPAPSPGKGSGLLNVTERPTDCQFSHFLLMGIWLNRILCILLAKLWSIIGVLKGEKKFFVLPKHCEPSLE